MPSAAKLLPGFVAVFSDYTEDGVGHQGLISYSCLTCFNEIISLLYCKWRFDASQFSSIPGALCYLSPDFHFLYLLYLCSSASGQSGTLSTPSVQALVCQRWPHTTRWNRAEKHFWASGADGIACLEFLICCKVSVSDEWLYIVIQREPAFNMPDWNISSGGHIRQQYCLDILIPLSDSSL